ncbi:YqaJ viral recombinase family nuclease [Nitrosovibrio sp. Nv4]|uniref:YqaJ viral recombinase family nuclease n=1 Tax=Nitrosovibrio sp. Nv4 TaxID=1945880 RepID=UPI000BC95B43|nr:YqaJ viral recombinase family protein [Nitrosovibrio sp. Nv4]SOD42421.1 putative phage-type endonuclease [Nitrosovibrio sp. Nv4]
MNASIQILTPDRQTFIGGSDVAAILGISKWKSPFQLYHEKIGAYVEESNPLRDKVLNRGKRWEPVVVEMLIDELESQGREVKIIGRNARYQDPQHPFLAAEIDLELLIDGEEVNGEIKTVHPFAAKDWGEEGTDEIPVYYTAQVMHGLMIKPRRRAIVAALIGADDLRLHEVVRDDDLITGIRAKEIEFWQRVQDRVAPEPTEAADVKWLYGKDLGTVAEADDGLALLCQALKDKKTSFKTLEEEIEELSTSIKIRIGNAATLLYRDRPIATWKTQQTNRLDTKALETAHPEIAVAFRKTTESRVLRLK